MTVYDVLTWAAILTAGLLQLALLVAVAWLITWPLRAPRRRRRERIRARLERLVATDMHPNLRRIQAQADLDTCEACRNADKEETK